MTEDGSTDSADEESPSADTDTADPGGGPTRVVSDQSVDDILDSLESTPRPDEETAAERSDRTAVDSADCDGTRVDADDGAASLEADEPTESAPNERSGDGLSARVDAGTVTGADVRAAEAGEGREKTPEVDEIDLSLDDLEDPADATVDDGAGATAGPSPESTGGRNRDSGGGDRKSTAETPSGILGRIRQLFSQ